MCENNSIKDYLAHKANGPAPIVKAEIPPRLGEEELLVVRRGRRTIEPKMGSSSGSAEVGGKSGQMAIAGYVACSLTPEMAKRSQISNCYG